MQKGAISAITLGVGLAGFWDGITLHSILQWHHMISSRVPPSDMRGMEINMFADGWFDLICWGVTVVGIALLFRDAKLGLRLSARQYIGWILIGSGLFNFVEGLIDHELLGIHHVHPASHLLAWDIGFLLVAGLLLIGVGWLLKREPSAVPLQLRRAA